MAALSESELPLARTGAPLAWRLAADDTLARAIANGRDGAFTALFARYNAPLVRYCSSILLNPEDAQDAAQNALTAALRALNSDRTPPLRLRPWLYRIAHNEAIAIARHRSPDADFDAALQTLAAPDHAPAREQLRELLGDLHTLPERQRSALVLRELSGLEYDEIGGALQMSAVAARRAVFDARAALHASRDGRSQACAAIRMTLSGGDGRTRRSRALRAHLEACADCSDYARQIDKRRHALRVLFPLPGMAALGGATATGGALLAGAGVATKCAALCATAAILGGSIAAIEVGRQHTGQPLSATAHATPTPAKRAHPHAVEATVMSASAAPTTIAAGVPKAPRAPGRERRTSKPEARVVSTGRSPVVLHASPKPAPVTTPPSATAPAPAPAPAAPAPAVVAPAAVAPAATPAAQKLQQKLTQAREAVEQAKSTVQTVVTQVQQSAQQQLDALRARLQAALKPAQAPQPPQ